jgi:hypothetical protein
MLLLFASEVAALIAKNPYRPQWQAFEQLWARTQKEQFEEHAAGRVERQVEQALEQVQAVAVAAQVHDGAAFANTKGAQAAEKAVMETVAERATAEAQARVIQAAALLGVTALNGTDVVAPANQAALAVLATETHNVAATQLLREATEFVKQRDEVVAKAASAVRCAYGTAREEASRQQLVEEAGVPVEHTNAFRSAKLGYLPYAKVAWGVGGRLDGLDAEGRVVEIKNRTRRFFTTVPEYERVQVACYMRIMNARAAVVVQQFNGEQRRTVVAHDEALWQNYVTLMRAVMRVYELFTAEDNVALRNAWVGCRDGGEKQGLLNHWLTEQAQSESD